MSKINSVLEPEILSRIHEIYQNQMSAFGGTIQGNEIKEVFFHEGYYCVKFNNGDWYHYDLEKGVWW